MIKQLVLYTQPDDEAVFLKHYREVHLPIVRRIPGVEKVVINQGQPMRGQLPFFLIVELHFADMAALVAAMGSPENREAARDIANFALGKVSVVVVQETVL